MGFFTLLNKGLLRKPEFSSYFHKLDFIVFGLGNPGAKYKTTRHNIGSSVVEFILSKDNLISYNYSRFLSKFCVATYQGAHSEKQGILSSSLSYMNESGYALDKLKKYFLAPKAARENIIIVVHDELDLEFGTIRIKKGGSAAGHNGVLSVYQFLDPNEIIRLRIGIGKNFLGKSGSQYVLEDFNEEEQKQIPNLLEKCYVAISKILDEGYSKAMEEFNKKN